MSSGGREPAPVTALISAHKTRGKVNAPLLLTTQFYNRARRQETLTLFALDRSARLQKNFASKKKGRFRSAARRRRIAVSMYMAEKHASGDFFPAPHLISSSAPLTSTSQLAWSLCSYENAVGQLVYQYFGGKMIRNATGYVNQDRLGSIGKFYPYGQERPSATTNGKEKFATYFRDSETGLDYAQARYHSSGDGRFLSPDPYQASAGPSDPGSWNRYAYVTGDPINYNDPAGLQGCKLENGEPCPPAQPPPPPVELPGSHPFRHSEDSPCAHYPEMEGCQGPKMTYDQYRGQLAGKRRELAKKVADKKVKDCDALLEFTGFALNTAAQNNMDLTTFVDGFGELIPSSTMRGLAGTADFFFGITSFTGDQSNFLNANSVASNFAAQYTDSIYESGDQAHHFAFFFQLGFQLNGLEATAIASLMDPNNAGDRALGIRAAQMGSALRASQDPYTSLASMKDLCK
jgi:RHS repeat-associated protein